MLTEDEGEGGILVVMKIGGECKNTKAYLPVKSLIRKNSDKRYFGKCKRTT